MMGNIVWEKSRHLVYDERMQVNFVSMKSSTKINRLPRFSGAIISFEYTKESQSIKTSSRITPGVASQVGEKEQPIPTVGRRPMKYKGNQQRRKSAIPRTINFNKVDVGCAIKSLSF